MVTFVIKGIPKAKQRPRFAARRGKVIAYTPKTTASFENLVKLKAEKEFLRPLEGTISLAIRFYLPRPQRMIWKTRPMPEACCDKRPDIDNLAKAVIDGLNGIAFRDDAQIADLHVTKKYHAGDGEPKTVIIVDGVKNHGTQSSL
ncbi:MAG: RusA family crossover junction endodeoxyribonuclease [Candidatus Thermoplasmatota archaeon]|nr:RusA family crossover junction endodeoxyribonuclease [Candidatus Thermoplasmatota archaeon]